MLWTLMVCAAAAASAQKTIDGVIKDSKTSAGLAGVSVKAKKSKAGTSTSETGEFKINIADKDELEFSAVGYKSISVAVGTKSEISVNMETASTELSDVVFIGSRGTPRSRSETAVPVDVVSLKELSSTTARPDLSSQLTMTVPSFNYNKQSGGDGSDAIDFASLRGLGFDQTLVLVNGKRRHLSAFVNQVGTRGRGNSGTDLNAIPEAAIDRIEILRDGASAQYGSDAIAGVINIILKKDIKKLNITTGYSGYYDHKYNTLNNVDPSQYYTNSKFDGQAVTLGLDYGLPIGKNGGFINFGGNFFSQGKTFRAVPDTNWTTNKKALSAPKWRRAFGDGGVVSAGGTFNMEIPVGKTSTTFYAFGSYNYKHSNVYAWTRNFGNPNHTVKYPTNEDGSLIFVPSIMHVAGPKTQILDSANVFYNPQEDVYIKDISGAIGFKGTVGNGWDWDLSNVIGHNDFHYWGNKTFNASLLPISLQAGQNRFDDGGFNFLQNTTNLDVSKHFASVASGMTLSFGGEFRYEHYKLYAGEVNSYLNGKAFYIDGGGDTVYKASGSEGYPGYQPSDEANAHRTNVGGYVDLAIDLSPRLLLDGAARFENYSDFGFVNTYKLAARFKATHNLNFRGSVSSGFRAPSLQQLNFSNTNTNIVAGQLQYVKLVPNYSSVARTAGIPPLKQETSLNASLGGSYKPTGNLTLTIDGYWIKMKNRIVITGNFDDNIPALAPVLAANNVSSVNFFTNAVNTTNYGVDIVADYHKKLGTGTLRLQLAGNIQHITVDKINIPDELKGTTGSVANSQAFFSTREQYFLTASAPAAKFSFNLEYAMSKLSVGAHLTYFGKLTTQGFGYATRAGADSGQLGGQNISDRGAGWDPYVSKDDGSGTVKENFVFHGKVTTDLYLTYKITKSVNWVLGVDNIFNVHPDLAVTKGAEQNSWGDSESGGPFDSVQMGFNGMRAFTKFIFNF